MNNDQRQHARFNPEGLVAHVTLENEALDQVYVNGEVINISHSGIRLKLTEPLLAHVNDKIKIQLILPESGIPLTIRGVIKHEIADNEFGLHYENPPSKNDYEDIILECFKVA